jgi:hypothetical protein
MSSNPLDNKSTVTDMFKLLHCEEGEQQYTLKVQDAQTKQVDICTYRDSPICTTHHDALISYTAHLIRIYNKTKIFTIARITDDTELNKEVGKALAAHY